MPKKTSRNLTPPAYRYHVSGRARVVFNGTTFYLGDYESSESWARYYELIAEWTRRGGETPDRPERLMETQITVGAVTAIRLEWIELIEKYPKNFILGSDVVADFRKYHDSIRKYNALLKVLKPETRVKVGNGNFVRVMPKNGLTIPHDYTYPESRFTRYKGPLEVAPDTCPRNAVRGHPLVSAARRPFARV